MQAPPKMLKPIDRSQRAGRRGRRRGRNNKIGEKVSTLRVWRRMPGVACIIVRAQKKGEGSGKGGGERAEERKAKGEGEGAEEAREER